MKVFRFSVMRFSVVFLLGFLMLLAGCGVPTDSKPQAIPSNELPFDLSAPSTTQAPSTLPVMTVPVKVYLLGPERLVPVQREVAAPASLGAVLAALIQGPIDTDPATLHSAVNPQTRVASAETSNDVAIVNVTNSFSGIALQEQIQALAQLVYSATGLDGITSVQIELNAAPVDVPRGDGTSTRDPLHRGDYSQLAPVDAG